jgi:uncharacterized protein YfaP (DUF2135 family)
VNSGDGGQLGTVVSEEIVLRKGAAEVPDRIHIITEMRRFIRFPAFSNKIQVSCNEGRKYRNSDFPYHAHNTVQNRVRLAQLVQYEHNKKTQKYYISPSSIP